MATVLTNEEKIEIINQHLRTIDYAIYNSELEKIEAEAIENPVAEVISAITDNLANLNLKRSALAAEKATLTE
jgi:hypothetical protein